MCHWHSSPIKIKKRSLKFFHLKIKLAIFQIFYVAYRRAETKVGKFQIDTVYIMYITNFVMRLFGELYNSKHEYYQGFSWNAPLFVQ